MAITTAPTSDRELADHYLRFDGGRIPTIQVVQLLIKYGVEPQAVVECLKSIGYVAWNEPEERVTKISALGEFGGATFIKIPWPEPTTPTQPTDNNTN